MVGVGGRTDENIQTANSEQRSILGALSPESLLLNQTSFFNIDLNLKLWEAVAGIMFQK